jgi:hypothetical protein
VSDIEFALVDTAFVSISTIFIPVQSRYKPSYEKLAEILAGDSDIMIVRIDGANNHIDHNR